MACEDFPCCGHEPGCCPDFDESGRQLNMNWQQKIGNWRVGGTCTALTTTPPHHRSTGNLNTLVPYKGRPTNLNRILPDQP